MYQWLAVQIAIPLLSFPSAKMKSNLVHSADSTRKHLLGRQGRNK